jgi:hypothetical protein
MNMTGWPDAMVSDYVSRGADYMITGLGSPEGVVASNRTRQYWATDDEKLYINSKVGSRTGWVPVV